MNLRQKVFKLLDVFYPEDTPDDLIRKEIDRWGKIDAKKTIEILWIYMEEIEELKEAVALLSKEQFKKRKK